MTEDSVKSAYDIEQDAIVAKQNSEMSALRQAIVDLEEKQQLLINGPPELPLPRVACKTCNILTQCPTCENPIGKDGKALNATINYLPVAEVEEHEHHHGEV